MAQYRFIAYSYFLDGRPSRQLKKVMLFEIGRLDPVRALIHPLLFRIEMSWP